jgi:Protein of unknown function (DUF3995)
MTDPEAARRGAGDRALRRVSVATAVWGLAYAGYRLYYALGGTAFLPGVPASPETFRLINAAAAAVLVVAGLLPLLALRWWSRRGPRRVLLALFWAVAVGCCMHALVNMVQRVLSLAGVLTIEYPASFWASLDTRTADLQDLFFNEPWFLIEGLGFAAIAWLVLGPGRARRRWVGSALVATGVLTLVGLLSATGVIGEAVVL